MASRCATHKTIVDAERNGSPPEDSDAPSDQPAPPLRNRFGAPNMTPP